MRTLLGALLLLPALVFADTYPRQPGVDAIHYVFRLTLNDATDQITGRATVTMKFVADDVREVVLDLASAAAGRGMTVQSVTHQPNPPRQPDQSLPFTHDNHRLRVTLPALSRAGQEISFTVAYSGVPAAGLHIRPNIHGERAMFSDSWPNNARQWLPAIDHPYDKATGEFIVTAPNHYQVVSNGLLIEELDLPNGQRRTHWKQSVPIASWLHALGVARFTSHHAGRVKDIPLQTWVFPQNRETGLALFEDLSRRALTFFIDHVGPYSYEKLANVQAVGISGGMELASAIFYGEKDVAAGRGPVVHEIAHQWFGNAVTERDWDDVWLSEGFATYFALLFTEHDEGRDAFVAALQRSRDQVLALTQKLPEAPIVHRNLDDMRRVLNGLIYQKGGWVLHMLRAEVGTEHFWTAIREYYRRYQNLNASTADLQAVFEQVSGKQLDWFFTQWLTRPGLPRLEGSWRYDAAARQVEVTLTQAQAADVFRLSVDIGIATAAGAPPAIERVEMTAKCATMRFDAATEPAAVIIDPGTWTLIEMGPFNKAK
ncbi:MAG: M1 family metallopeptidase [Vicinamibacterales bacterium]